MRNQSENLLAILKSAVHHEALSLNEPVEYDCLMELAREQSVLPIVGEMLCRDPEFIQEKVYEQTVRQVVASVAAQSSRTAAFLQLYRAFADAGVYPVVMKGVVCRELYGRLKDHRPSGDEDILIRPAEFKTVRAVLKSQGYEPERKEMTDRQLEEVQEITFDGGAAGLHIEVHTNPIGQESGIRRDMNEMFQSVFENQQRIEVDGTEIMTMGHTDHFLFLVLHAFKHMISNSFGIRQALDILLYYEKYGDEICWDYVYDNLRKVCAERFFCDLLYIGRQHLGFDLPAKYRPNCPEELLTDLMENGIFGSKRQAYQTAASITTAAIDRGKKRNQIMVLLQTCFPPMEFMISRNPELADYPWLLPVCWIRRWGRFFRYSRDNGGGLVSDSIEASRQRIRLLKKYKIL